MSGNNYICQNAACTQVGINKPSFVPLIGDVICGTCGSICTDGGPTTETFGVEELVQPAPHLAPPPVEG